MDFLFRVLTSLVIVIHLAFVCFVVLGALMVLRWPRLIWIHVPAAVWGVLIEFTGSICPLTPLEKWLRSRGGQVVYAGDFIDHYIVALIYPAGLTREAQLLLGVMVVVINVFVYWRLYRRTRFVSS